MAIANAHHPQIINSWKVLVNDVCILICLLLTWYEALPRLNSVGSHRPLCSWRWFLHVRNTAVFPRIQMRNSFFSRCTKRSLWKSWQILIKSQRELIACHAILLLLGFLALPLFAKYSIQVLTHRQHVPFVRKIELVTISNLLNNIWRVWAHCSVIHSIIH